MCLVPPCDRLHLLPCRACVTLGLLRVQVRAACLHTQASHARARACASSYAHLPESINCTFSKIA